MMDREQARKELEIAENDLLILDQYGGRENNKDRQFLKGRINALKEMLGES